MSTSASSRGEFNHFRFVSRCSVVVRPTRQVAISFCAKVYWNAHCTKKSPERKVARWGSMCEGAMK